MAEEGFHDYTLATRLERLVAQLEQCFRGWLLTGLENLSHMPPALGADKQPINLVRVSSNINHRMPWRAQPYILTLHVPYTREADLQAARQRQQQQQQLQQNLHQQQLGVTASPQKAPTLSKQPPPRQQGPRDSTAAAASEGVGGAAAMSPGEAVAIAAAAPPADRADAAAAASKVLAQHVVAATAGGQQGADAMQKLQAELAPLLNSTANGDNNGNGQQQQHLQQQVDELVQQYLHVQRQLQAEAGGQQQHHEAEGDQAEQQQQQQQWDDQGPGLAGGARTATRASVGGNTATHPPPPAAAAAAGEAAGPAEEIGAGSADSLSAGTAAAGDALSAPVTPALNVDSSDGTAASTTAHITALGQDPTALGQDPAALDSKSAAVVGGDSIGSSRSSSSGGGVKGGRKLQAKRLQRTSAPSGSMQQQQQQQLGTVIGGSSRRASSSTGATGAVLLEGGQGDAAAASAAAAGGLAAGGERVPDDEATSRQVELPAPEQLVDANSRALAAVKAAVQQDHSRTAASRSWWPFCFDTAAIQQQQQQAAGSILAPGSVLVPGSILAPNLQQQLQAGIPSIGLPWWSPGAGANKLQRWFGVDLFVLLQPASYSRRFLDAAESSSLLSVARLALSSAGVAWPLLLPVHDAVRDAYVGVAQVGGLSVVLHTDSIHISRLPRHLSAPEQQLALFAEQLTCHNPAAAAACLAVLGQQQDSTAAAKAGAVGAAGPLGALHNSSSSLSSNPGWAAVTGSQSRQIEQQQEGVGSAGQYGVFISACFTYRLPDASKRFSLQHLLSSPAGKQYSHSAAQQQTDGAGNEPYHPQSHHQQQHHHQQQQHVAEGSATEEEDTDFLDWDADSAWHPWAQHRDPVHALELDIVWQDTQLSSAAGGSAAGGAAGAGDDGTGSLLAAAAAAVGESSSIIAAAGAGRRPALSPAGMAALVAEPAGADVWLLHVLQHGFSNAPARSGRLGVKGYERHRRHVRVEAAGADWLWSAAAAQEVLAFGGRLSGVCPQPWGYVAVAPHPSGPPLDPGSFTTMLSALMTARTAAATAHSLWELSGADWWESRGEPTAPPLPPDSIFDSVLRDLLSPPRTTPAAAAGSNSGNLSRRSSREVPAASHAAAAAAAAAAAGGISSRSSSGIGGFGSPAAAAGAADNAAAAAAGEVALPRSAPPGSLLCRLALHALVFGNARAIAALWQRFVIQARLQFWEQRTLLPYLPAGGCGSSNGSGSRRNSISLQGSRTSFGSVSAFASAAGGAASNSGSSSSSGAAGVTGGPPAPDLDSCLVHQKLQMLNMCIWRRDKRLARGLSSSKIQQQQQLLRSRQANSSSSIAGSKSVTSSPGDDDSDVGAAEAAAAAGGSSSRLATAASSTFYSVSGEDNEDEADAETTAAAAAGDTIDTAAAAAASDDDSPQQQQQQQRQELFEDANSEFYSLTSSIMSGAAAADAAAAAAAGSSDASSPSPPPAAAVSDPDAEPQGVAAVLPGQTLLLYPDRPLRVPVVQDDPAFTEDQMIQRQVAVMQLAAATAEDSSSSRRRQGGVGSGAAELLLLKQRLLAAPLLSDMCAFKAANPGCCFEDFLRWYSPKDWQQQQQEQHQQQVVPHGNHLSISGSNSSPNRSSSGSPSGSSSQASCPTPADTREPSPADTQDDIPAAGTAAAAAAAGMPPVAAKAAAAAPAGGGVSARMAGGPAGPANDWQQLWLLAEPQPASAQRPLLNPQKEGELVLHYLETLSPLALFSQLLAAAVCEALALLAASRGAALPAAAAVVDRFRSMASGVLRKGGGLSAAAAAGGAPGAAQQQQHELAGDWQGAEDGLSDVELELLLAEFAYVEQVVVLGESLLHHLPGQPALAARLLHHLLHGADPTSTTAAHYHHQQQRQHGNASPSAQLAAAGEVHDADAAAAAAECGVLGVGSRLPVACLTQQERLGLMRWVAACSPTDSTTKLQRDLAHISSSQHHQQQQQGWGGGVEGLQRQGGWGDSSSSPLQSPGSAAASTGSHLHSLASPKGDWPSGGFTAAAAAPGHTNSRSWSPVASPAQQQQQQWGHQEQQGQAQEAAFSQLRRLQPALGQPAQREWVLTCGPLPHIPTNSNTSSSGTQKTAAGVSIQQQGVRRLRPAVAAAVAAASGVPAGGSGCVSGVSGIAGPSGPPVPPSRLYLQEADGEMRLAALLVSQQGL